MLPKPNAARFPKPIECVYDDGRVLTVIQDRPEPPSPVPDFLTQDEITDLVDAGPVFKGPTGPSLYDLWLEAGNEGTLDDFLALFVPVGGGGGSETPQLRYALNGVASYVATHGLSKIPNVTILDATGEEVETDVRHSAGRTTLIFPQPFTGTLYLE